MIALDRDNFNLDSTRQAAGQVTSKEWNTGEHRAASRRGTAGFEITASQARTPNRAKRGARAAPRAQEARGPKGRQRGPRPARAEREGHAVEPRRTPA